MARRFCGNGRYSERQLGVADDFQDADGTFVITFRQAQDAARAWWKVEQRRALGLGSEQRGPYSVRVALEDYVKDYIRRGGKDLANLRSIIDAHILPALGALDTCKLTAKQIRDWHHTLAASPRLTRGRQSGETMTVSQAPVDPEAVRRRRSRANRILTVLKAALNHGFAEHSIPSHDAWRRVAPFRSVDIPRIRYLNAGECGRLINACDPEFRALARAAILTGARYGELIRLKVTDVNLEARTIHIRESKSGKPRHAPLTDEAREHFEQLVLGRTGGEPVFRRADGRSWKRSEQARPLLAACKRAGITPPITFHGLRDTFASVLAMNGAPMAVIARVLGHADTRITEKHYAHLAPNYVAESLRAHFPRLSTPSEAPNLVPVSFRKG